MSVDVQNLFLNEDVHQHAVCLKLAELLEIEGGRAILVGGWVRDALLGLAPKDIDIEVYGIGSNRLEKLLRRSFQVITVGKAFGVLKIKGEEIDVAIPRRESKTGPGHRGFSVTGDPQMDFREAAARRDFTINAIGWDPLKNELLDPFDGRNDLEKGILKHTSDKFAEDPLRVLRGMQFAARFNLQADPSTIALCKNISPEDLSSERIFEEWKKLILKGQKPSLGLRFLKQTGWTQYFPELHALIECPQDPLWHPEGDVWVHTLHCLDAFARERVGEDWEDLVVGFAVLCHDFGKPATTGFSEGRYRSPMHESEGETPARSFLNAMTNQKALIEEVIPLVTHHMRPAQLYKSKAGPGAIRRLAEKVLRIDRLIRVAQADMNGRPPKKGRPFEAGDWLLEQALNIRLADSAPKPVVKGRHLIDLGHAPGPNFKEILNQCFEAQLDGLFESEEDGLKYLQELLGRKS